jgi:hypothetical protein
MGDSGLLAASHFNDTCYDAVGTKVNQVPCGWSTKMGSSLCCPINYQCMRNGLCKIPDTDTIKASTSEYELSHPLRLQNEVAWVQLPTCTSKDPKYCNFDYQSCSTSQKSIHMANMALKKLTLSTHPVLYLPTSTTTGFIPLDDCTSQTNTIPSENWLSCKAYHSKAPADACRDAQSLYRNWVPIGEALCPAYRDATCDSALALFDEPPGVSIITNSSSGNPDPSSGGPVPAWVIYPSVILGALFVLLFGLCVFYHVRRRGRQAQHDAERAAAAAAAAPRDSFDQGLPAYEEHWCGSGAAGPATSEWPGPGRPVAVGVAVGSVWLEPPPDYVPKVPEVHELPGDAHPEGRRAEDSGRRLDGALV